MNSQLSEFARDYLKKNLSLLPEGSRDKFRAMYGYGPQCRDWEVARSKPIDQIVDEMPDDKLDWAMSQVENTLKNLKPEIKTYEHSPVCNGDRRKPPGTPGTSCSCRNVLRRFSREELDSYMKARSSAMRKPEPVSEPHREHGDELPF